MSVQAESLEVLEQGNLSSVQALAIVRAIEIELAGARDVLATKHDMILLRSEFRQEATLLRSEMSELGTALRSEMSQLETSLRGDMAQLETSLRSDMAQLETSLRSDMAQLETNLRGEITNLRMEMRAEISGFASSIARQMYTAMLGQMAVLLGIAYFFVTQIANR
jgi:hypothetical protein